MVALRKELGHQGSLRDKEMLLHKAALEQLISASSPSMKSSPAVKNSLQGAPSGPSVTSTPLKRPPLSYSTPSPSLADSRSIVSQAPSSHQQYTADISDTTLFPAASPVPSTSLPLMRPSPSSSGDSGEALSTTLENDPALESMKSMEGKEPRDDREGTETAETVYADCTDTPYPSDAVDTLEADEEADEAEGAGAVSVEAAMQTEPQDLTVNEVKISVLSEEIRSLNRFPSAILISPLYFPFCLPPFRLFISPAVEDLGFFVHVTASHQLSSSSSCLLSMCLFP